MGWVAPTNGIVSKLAGWRSRKKITECINCHIQKLFCYIKSVFANKKNRPTLCARMKVKLARPEIEISNSAQSKVLSQNISQQCLVKWPKILICLIEKTMSRRVWPRSTKLKEFHYKYHICYTRWQYSESKKNPCPIFVLFLVEYNFLLAVFSPFSTSVAIYQCVTLYYYTTSTYTKYSTVVVLYYGEQQK